MYNNSVAYRTLYYSPIYHVRKQKQRLIGVLHANQNVFSIIIAIIITIIVYLSAYFMFFFFYFIPVHAIHVFSLSIFSIFTFSIWFLFYPPHLDLQHIQIDYVCSNCCVAIELIDSPARSARALYICVFIFQSKAITIATMLICRHSNLSRI